MGRTPWNWIGIRPRAPGANNGYLTFWVDSEQQGNITGIDNDTRRVTSARMGAFSGIDSGTRGNIFFDAFESRYTEYIGLDPNALTPPAPPTKTDALFADGFESGGLTNWAVTTTTGGDLSVQPQAAVTGTYGLKVAAGRYHGGLHDRIPPNR